MNRRKFSQELLTTLSSFALIESVLVYDTVGNAIKPITKHWALQLNEYCRDLKKDAISPVE